jgi:hypothetical protein
VIDDVYPQPMIPLEIPLRPDPENEDHDGEKEGSGGECEGEEGVDERLDSMNKRLGELILEGRRALGERPILSGGDGLWVDDLGDEGVK